MELLDHAITAVTSDPIFLWFIVGLLLASIGLVLAFTLPDGKGEVTNDRYLPDKAISNVDQRYNKYDWK